MTTTAARSAALDPLDPLGLDEEFTSDDRLIRDMVRDFVQKRVLPDIGDWFERGFFPKELALELGELGLLGMHLDGYGCAGASATAYGIACRELEAADSGLRSFVSVQGSLAMFPIHAYGSEQQKEEWLPRMARGEAIGCFGLTEWDHGSDPSGMRTTARRDGVDYVLNGSKAWITNGGIADVAVVWARVASDNGESGALRGFVVPTTAKGFSARNIERKISLRASITSELVMNECRLPADAVLPNVSSMRGPLSCLSEARYGILWGALGAARACYESALEYAKTRVQFGKPIAGFQLTQEKLVNMMLELQKGQLLASKLGRLKDAGSITPQQVSIGKLNNVREALAICREARTILGASGVTLEYPIIRHMNNLESVLTYEGTSEVHMLILGQALTGISAFA
ncbi:MAG: acyl-CoA dehydrogenase family protein [Candidatus Eremiobacteraeota bacterium]|nr:acyl-CoA dehydrogenase family protein [Candidatus Eremiobacteraeota bacterium]